MPDATRREAEGININRRSQQTLNNGRLREISYFNAHLHHRVDSAYGLMCFKSVIWWISMYFTKPHTKY